MPARLLAAIGLALACLCAQAGPLFTVDGDKPQRVVVTAGPDLPAAFAAPLAAPNPPPDADMLRTLAGVRAVHDTRRDLRALNAALGRLERDPVPDATAGAHLHLIAGDAARTLALIQTAEGDRFARDPATGETCVVNPGALRRLEAGWLDLRRPAGAPPDLPVAQVVDLDPPYTPSPITLDVRTLGDRFFRGRGQPDHWPAMDRVLNAERFSVRLPANHDPARPAGLLVWQSPAPRGDIPRTFHDAADAFNLICIGAHNAGNYRGTTPDRPEDSDPADRFQLCLDAVATARAHWWIDPDRVYITGLSGGGRIASMFWHCFPDVFKGAVPIVGLNSPHRVPIRPGFVSPPGYMRPAPSFRAATRTQRLAAITGTEDFNGPETVARVRALLADRKAVRLWNIEAMAHVFPEPGVFTEAIEWIDEPVRASRTERLDEARELLGAHTDEHGDAPPPTPDARDRLIEVTRLAPWTEPAWRAAALLGFVGG